MNDFLSLSNWLDYVEARADCDRHGLGEFTAELAAKDNAVQDVRDAFERGFYTQWLLRQLDQTPAVKAFRRRIYEQRAERFAKLDVQQHEIARNGSAPGSSAPSRI